MGMGCPGEMPTGQPDPRGRGRWYRWSRTLGPQQGKPFHNPSGKGDRKVIGHSQS